MAALAGYYIGANQNTMFSYNSLGFIYLDEDDFYYINSQTLLTQPVSADTSGATKTLNADFSAYQSTGVNAAGCGGRLVIALGPIGSQEYLCATQIGSTQFQTTDPIRNSYPVGTEVWQIANGHQATDALPPVQYIYRWGAWFPAMGVDIGQPDPNGWNGGARDMAWKSGASVTGLADKACGAPTYVCSGVWRRDYTNAIVLVRPFLNGETDPAELDTPSQTIDLGGNYYLLSANGSTGPAISSVTLRGSEGAMLMKSPRTAYRSVLVGFNLNSVQNAATFQATLTGPDGSSTSYTCSASPCMIQVNSALGNSLLGFGYVSGAGKTITPVVWTQLIQ
jgi:hypothetical protein